MPTLDDARQLSPAAQARIRRRVIKAVDQGRSQKEAAALFGVHPGTVNRWVQAWRQSGEATFEAGQRGRPAEARLAPHQAATIVRMIRDRCPDQLKLPFALWTREAVAALIERRFKLRLSVWTVGRYLHRWGLTPQKPLRRAYEQDPQATSQWLEEEYPRIQRDAKAAGAQIIWGDEMGMRSDHQTGTSWGVRGQTPTIPGTGQRFRCNMLSAISNRGQLWFMLVEHRVTAPVFIAFLRRLQRQVRRPVILIVDRHPVHRSRAVQRWIQRQQGRIRLEFLPAYSPELNPDEVLNQDVKTNAVGRRRPRTKADLLANVRGYLRSTQRQPAIVRKYFQETHVRYAA